MTLALLDRPGPFADTSRRRFLTGVAAAGLLTGCGTASPTAATGSTAPGFPRTVRHEAGDTVVPRPPTRILSLTDGAELGAMLSLGIVPFAYGQRNDPLLPWIAAAGGEDPAIDRFPLDSPEVNFEQLAAMRPEVILGQYGFVTEDNIATYQAIAPTVATSFIDWRESLRQVSEATATEDRARTVVDDLDARIAAATQRLTALAGIRVAILSVFEGNEIYALNAASPAGEILARLGAAPLPAPQADGEAADLVSAELVGSVLECDVALIQIYDGDRAGYDSARAAGIFDSITAFRDGRVVELSSDDSQALYFSSVLTILWCVDVLERSLNGARR